MPGEPWDLGPHLFTCDCIFFFGARIPISRIYGPVRPSTVGRWTQTLRKYGITARKGMTIYHGPRNQGRIEETTNLARIPLVDYDFDREVNKKWLLPFARAS